MGFVSLDLLQDSNKVYDAINTILPFHDIDKTDTTFGLESRKDIQLNIMTRRRYRWDIYCEKIFDRDYMTFFDEMVKIRPYFYPISEIMQLKNSVNEGHSHDYLSKNPWRH